MAAETWVLLGEPFKVVKAYTFVRVFATQTHEVPYNPKPYKPEALKTRNS